MVVEVGTVEIVVLVAELDWTVVLLVVTTVDVAELDEDTDEDVTAVEDKVPVVVVELAVELDEVGDDTALVDVPTDTVEEVVVAPPPMPTPSVSDEAGVSVISENDVVDDPDGFT